MKVRKAIIPAAGLGTRFLPATKAQPKEMLPIVDKPAIQYIVEEAVASGIEDVIIITGRGKRSIEDHFDKAYELEDTLLKTGKLDVLKDIQAITNLVNITYIRQKEPNGLGHAISCAKNVIGNEPFAVLLGDDIVRSEKPCLQQLMEIYEYYNSSVVGVQMVPEHETSKYGIIKPKGEEVAPNLVYIDSLVEKPKFGEAASRFAVMGRYILKPEIFAVLEQIPYGQGNELQLTDAISELNKQQAVLAYNFEGIRYDVGDRAGFIKATLDFALNREELREELLAYLKRLLEDEKTDIEWEISTEISRESATIDKN
jgi:UTP--glucose-1-phosphate uridylyltransferase